MAQGRIMGRMSLRARMVDTSSASFVLRQSIFDKAQGQSCKSDRVWA